MVSEFKLDKATEIVLKGEWIDPSLLSSPLGETYTD